MPESKIKKEKKISNSKLIKATAKWLEKIMMLNGILKNKQQPNGKWWRKWNGIRRVKSENDDDEDYGDDEDVQSWKNKKKFEKEDLEDVIKFFCCCLNKHEKETKTKLINNEKRTEKQKMTKTFEEEWWKRPINHPAAIDGGEKTMTKTRQFEDKSTKEKNYDKWIELQRQTNKKLSTPATNQCKHTRTHLAFIAKANRKDIILLSAKWK